MTTATTVSRSLLGDLRANSAWAKLPLFDRKGWKRVRFGDVVENLSVTERDLAGAGIERFVAMEHLEPGSLHIREWGNVADGTTFNRRCWPGQVLFGKRRAYQRKVAVAEFDAVVSGDIYVFAPKDDRLLPELLPFLCISERFFNFAVETSAGSLSPRTNWSSLVEFELDLPPLALQQRIAEILWAADEACVTYRDTSNSCSAAANARLANFFGHIANGGKSRFSTKPLDEVVRLQTGIAKGKTYAPNVPTMKLPYLRVANVQDGHLDLSEMKTIVIPRADKERYLLRDGDMVICEGGDFDKVGRGAIWREQISDCVHQNHVFCLRAHRSIILPEFLALQLGSPYGKQYFLGCAKKTSNLASINSTQVKAFPFQLPSLAVQQQFVTEMNGLQMVGKALESHIAASRRMHSVLTEVFV